MAPSLMTYTPGVSRTHSPAEHVTVTKEAATGPLLVSMVTSSRRRPVPAPTHSRRKDGGGCDRPCMT